MLNKVQIIGRLGQDPESKTLNNGQTAANFSVATTEKWTDKDGNRQEKTEWHRAVVFGKIADTCVKYLSKGRLVYIEGKLQTRSWEDQQGAKKYMTEIVVSVVKFLGDNKDGESKSSGSFEPSFDSSDEIPF